LQALVDGVFWVSLLAVAFGPLLVLRLRYGARLRWALLGIASWVVGCTAKVVIHYGCGLDHPVDSLGLQLARGTLSGVVSGATELAAAALILVWARLKLADVLAFGAGIGAFEVPVILASACTAAPLEPTDPLPIVVQLNYPMERAITLVFHTATRLLVYVAVRRHALGFGLLALLAFTLLDGAADHGTMAGWDFYQPSVGGGFLAFHAVLTTLVSLAAWRAWRSAPPAPQPPVPGEETCT